MEKEKSLIEKIAVPQNPETKSFDPQNFLNDINYYKNNYAGGRIGFEELKKKYKEELATIGLDLEEVDNLKSKTEAKKEIITIEDPRRLANYLDGIDAKSVTGPQIAFLDSVLIYFVEGVRDYYDTKKPDKRLEDLLLVAPKIIEKYKEFDEGQKTSLFPKLRDLEEQVGAARGGYLREFNFLDRSLNHVPRLKDIWNNNFDKELYLKTLDNISKRTEKIKQDPKAYKNCIFLFIDLEKEFSKDLEFAQSLLVKNAKEDEFMDRALTLLYGNPGNKTLKEVTEKLEEFLNQIRK